jgi:tetratricopeptide (TPR) repeat protein
MAENLSTVEALRLDPDYRWNENLTEGMELEELWASLIRAAAELRGQREFECSYGIYRELVWRFPERPDAWEGLATFAARMGYHREALVALEEAERLNSSTF